MENTALENLIMRQRTIGGHPVVCIVGPTDSQAAFSCRELKKAITSPEMEVDLRVDATGAEFRCGERIYRASAHSMEPIEILSQYIKVGGLEINPFEEEGMSGFTISRA